MKLYATVTSERASKGQGGNEWLDVSLTYKPKKGEAFEFMKLEILPLNDGIAVKYTIDDTVAYLEKAKKKCEMTGCKNPNASPYAKCREHIKRAEDFGDLKGEKQKGERLYSQAQDNCEHLYRDASDKRFCVDCGKRLK